MASGVASSGSSSASESSNGTDGASLAATSPVTTTAVSSSWPAAAQRREEAAERLVVRVDRVIVERPGAHAVVVLESAGVLAHLRERLGRAPRLDDAEVAVGGHRLQVLGRRVPRRVAAARVHDDEEAVALARLDPRRGLVEHLRGRRVLQRVVRRRTCPSRDRSRTRRPVVGFAVNIAVATPPCRHASSTVTTAVGQARVGIVEAVRARRAAPSASTRRRRSRASSTRGSPRTSSPRAASARQLRHRRAARPTAPATSPTCSRARRATTPRTAGGVAVGAGPASHDARRRRGGRRVPVARAHDRRARCDASAPSPSRPVTGTDHGAQAAPPPSTCAVPSTIGVRRSRMQQRLDVGVSSAGRRQRGLERRVRRDPAGAAARIPGARSDSARIERPPTVASMDDLAARRGRVGFAGSPVPTCTQSISARASSVARGPADEVQRELVPARA